MDPYYYRSSTGSISASSAHGGYSSSSYRVQPQYSLTRDPVALDRWSSIPLPSTDLAPFSSYPRSSLDHRLDRVSSFPHETLVPRSYVRPLQDFPPPRRFGDARPARRKPVAAQSLGPKKTALKPSQGAKAGTKAVLLTTKEVEMDAEKKAVAEAKLKEIKELHSLWRTGVDSNPTKKQKVEDGEGVAKEKKVDEVVKKFFWRKRKRGPSRHKRKRSAVVVGEDGSVVVRKNPRWTDEKQGIVDLQREVGKSAREFLGISDTDEAANKETPPEADLDEEAEQKTEEKVKEVSPEEAKVKEEEAKVKEEEAFEYFSKMFEENQALQKHYLESYNFGIFECVVCVAISVKFVHRFRSVVSLVTHASKTLKPKLLPQHRGFGRAVCSLMGWDHLKLPPVPRGKGSRISPPIVKGGAQENKDSDMVDAGADSKVENGEDVEACDNDEEEAPEEVKADEEDEKTEKDSSATEATEEA